MTDGAGEPVQPSSAEEPDSTSSNVEPPQDGGPRDGAATPEGKKATPTDSSSFANSFKRPDPDVYVPRATGVSQDESYLDVKGAFSSDLEPPTKATLEAIRSKISDLAPIVGVCSRFQPDYFAHCAFKSHTQELRIWRIAEGGYIATQGDIERLVAEISARREPEPNLYWFDCETSENTDGAPGLLRSLLVADARAKVAKALIDNAARLVVVIKHTGVNELRGLYRGGADSLSRETGWIHEVQWERELPNSWLGSVSGREAEQDFQLVTRAQALLADPSWRRQTHRFFQELYRFHEESVFGSSRLSADELNMRYQSAIEAAEKAERHFSRLQTWIPSAVAIFDQQANKLLEKTMLTIAACFPADKLVYDDFRKFGALALNGRVVIQEVSDLVEEKSIEGRPPTSTRRMTQKQADAPALWRERFDHLMIGVGLAIRPHEDPWIVRFRDQELGPEIRKMLLKSYPSQVKDLCEGLIEQDALFYPDADMRACVHAILLEIGSFDRTLYNGLAARALDAADRLMRWGARAGTLVQDVSKKVFEARRHALCVAELFRLIALAAPDGHPQEALRGMLIDVDLWRADVESSDRILLRTEVLLALPILGGMPQLARQMDDASPAMYKPLREAMLFWLRYSSDRVAALSSLSPWMTEDNESLALRRSQMLAHELWIAAIVFDLFEGSRSYGSVQAHAPDNLGTRIVAASPQAINLLPSLMRVRWRDTRLGGMPLEDIRKAMIYLLLIAPERSAAGAVVERDAALLFRLSDEVLVQPRAETQKERDQDKGADDSLDLLVAMNQVIEGITAVSDGDPATFESLLREQLRKMTRAGISLNEFLDPARATIERFVWPLDLFTGLVLAHWCFQRTGIDAEADQTAIYRGVAHRNIIGDYLDAMVEALDGQPAKFGAPAITQQWRWLGNLLSRLAQAVSATDELDQVDKIQVVRMLKQKKAKLDLLRSGLDRRIAARKENGAIE